MSQNTVVWMLNICAAASLEIPSAVMSRVHFQEVCNGGCGGQFHSLD